MVKPVATLAGNSISVTVGSQSPGLVLSPPANTVLSSTNQIQGLTYTVAAAAGCAGLTNAPLTIQFNAGSAADASVSVAVTLSASASPLAATPVVLTCVRGSGAASTNTPGPAQSVSVISATPGGTPFTVDATSLPSWLSVTPLAGGVANPTGVAITVAALSPCGGFAAGTSNSASIHLRNLPAPDALIPVTLQILGPPPVNAAPAAPTLSYTKQSGTPATATVALSAAGSAAATFAIDPASMPSWLSVDASSGGLPKSLHFTTTSIADSIPSGIYNATVQVQVPGYLNLAVPFHLTVNDPPPTLIVSDGVSRNLTWTIGHPLPIPYVTLASSGAPIAYTIATAGPLAPVVSNSFLKGFAYGYDTPIPITFNPNVFAAAPAASILTGTVSITWGNPATTTVVTLNVSVQSAAATVLAVSPASLPTGTPGQTFTVALSGTNFVAGSDPAQRTTVGIVSGGSLVSDPNITATVVNPSNIIVTLTVPASADSYLPFGPAASGGTITLGVCNPLGASCSTPTGAATLTIGVNPLIQALTSASAFVQVNPPVLPAVAPYDIVSLFGINFCASCAGNILYGAPDSVTLRFPTSLTPSGGPGTLTVTFQTHAAPPVAVATAPLLFATNNQINLLVPSAVSNFIGKTIDAVVNAGSSASAPFSVTVAAADPGLFTVGSDGQGDGAILGLDWSLIGQGNPAGIRQNAADSDTVQIFATGLGAPDSKADNSVAGGGLWPADCASSTSYLASLNKLTSGAFPNLDGTLTASAALSAGRLVPCLQSTASIPTVTIGGQPAVVTYAGWVPDSVAGQYQLNVRLPGSVAVGPLSAPTQLPVLITVGGRSSQPGVTIWVAPRLKVTAPAAAALHGAIGVAWAATANQATASQGTAPYQLAITAGSLPPGLQFNTATGAITGIPAAGSAGSYTVTVTATDSAAAPLTGSATFTLTVAGH